MINKSYFNLFENCIPVKGYLRSIIYDLQRNDYSFIPNELYRILIDYSDKSIQDILCKYDRSQRKNILLYFNFLLEKEYIFLCSKKEKNRFPPLELIYRSPYLVNNVVIEVSKKSKIDYQKLFNQLDYLGNIDLQFKFIDNFELKDIEDVLVNTINKRIKYIEIYTPIIKNIKKETLVYFLKSNLRVSKVVFYGGALHSDEKLECDDLSIVLFTDKDLARNDGCGQVNSRFFTIDVDFFTESIKYNSCLNGKLAITWKGEMKNCLSLNEVFGNINSDKIETIVLQKKFQKLWKIRKDLIEECQDCEFRYMCSDCRAKINDEFNMLSKPKYCNYNPYKAEYR